MSDLPQLRFLRRCHGEFAQNSSGKLADYIPELTKANPAHFGICIATVDGYVNERGDCLVPFTIQSISKAFVFAMALETIGADKVEATIGVEPSGDAFNAIRLNVSNAGGIAAGARGQPHRSFPLASGGSGRRAAPFNCRPERSEGPHASHAARSVGEIQRCAQDDKRRAGGPRSGEPEWNPP